MKILVFSDSHQTQRYMQDAIEQEHPNHIIHLGDHTRDAEALERQYPTLPVLYVRGNCDYDLASRELAITEFRGFRFFIAHGHRYGVKRGLLSFELAAREAMADVALFGHTHQAVCENYNGLWLMNPGSCGAGTRPSYGVVEIENGSLRCRLAYFD